MSHHPAAFGKVPMSMHQRLTEYDGLRVVEFGRDSGSPLAAGVAWLVRADDEGEFFGRFLETVDTVAVSRPVPQPTSPRPRPSAQARQANGAAITISKRMGSPEPRTPARSSAVIKLF